MSNAEILDYDVAAKTQHARPRAPMLTFRNVDAYYGRAQILRDVSLEVGSDERVAVLGRNGVGKTTLVNSFLGVAAVRSGSIEFAGQPMPGRARHFSAARAGISVVPQGRRIVPGLTVRENLRLGAAVERSGPWDMAEIFKLFPILRERADNPGTALSGGQQQMLAIGRALMANPRLLVLDEPSEGLAPVIVDELADVLCKLGESGTGIFLIEQNFGLVHRVAQRYLVLGKGAIVDSGSLADLSMATLKKHVAI